MTRELLGAARAELVGHGKSPPDWMGTARSEVRDRLERVDLVGALPHHSPRALRDLVPRSGQVTQRLGDDEAGVGPELVENLQLGMQLSHLLGVRRVVERARGLFA